MPQKTVNIDGRQLGVIVVRGEPVMTLKQIAYAFGITEPVATQLVFVNYKGLLPEDASFIATPDECAEAEVIIGKGKYPRLFKASAIMAMREKLIKKTCADRYYDVLEHYFGDDAVKKSVQQAAGFRPGVILPPPEVKAKELSEDDEILDLATKILADRKRSKAFKQTINDAIAGLKKVIKTLEEDL